MTYDTREKEQQLVELLLEADEAIGLSTTEIATQLGVTPQTVRNMIKRLSANGTPIYEVEGTQRYTVDKRAYLRPMRLSLAQGWMLYLPLRRMVRAQLHRYSVVWGLLHRLAAALSPELADALLDSQVEQAPTPFDKLVEAWHKMCWVQIQYQPLDRTYSTTYRVAPYWFEPAVWSDSVYLIAGVEQRDGIAPLTLKIERILSAKLLPDLPYERPDPDHLLRRIETTWGIWGSDEAMADVTLRFHHRVKARLDETRWHPTQQMSLAEDGSVLWTARIAEAREMLPWIRGWGADVEVLSPDWLRQEIANDAERTVRLYGRGGRKSFFALGDDYDAG